MVKVKVDCTKCDGNGICVDVCPIDIFELQDLPEHPDTQKSIPVREDECILCMACVASCPQKPSHGRRRKFNTEDPDAKS